VGSFKSALLLNGARKFCFFVHAPSLGAESVFFWIRVERRKRRHAIEAIHASINSGDLHLQHHSTQFNCDNLSEELELPIYVAEQENEMPGSTFVEVSADVQVGPELAIASNIPEEVNEPELGPTFLSVVEDKTQVKSLSKLGAEQEKEGMKTMVAAEAQLTLADYADKGEAKMEQDIKAQIKAETPDRIMKEVEVILQEQRMYNFPFMLPDGWGEMNHVRRCNVISSGLRLLGKYGDELYDYSLVDAMRAGDISAEEHSCATFVKQVRLQRKVSCPSGCEKMIRRLQIGSGSRSHRCVWKHEYRSESGMRIVDWKDFPPSVATAAVAWWGPYA